MQITKELLEKILVKPGHLSMDQLKEVVAIGDQEKTPYLDVILNEGYLSDQNLGRTVAESLGVPFVDLKDERIDREVLHLIPETVARKQQVIAYRQTPDAVHVATTHPDNYEVLEILEKKLGKKLEIEYATQQGIGEALHGYKSDSGTLAKKLLEDINENPANERRVIELVNAIMQYAYDSGASDIHIEPLEQTTIIRFRMDGILHEVLEYPKDLHEKLVFRIKIMSRLHTDEHAATQDGRFEFRMDRGKFDVRVSIAPITNGETIVMRLLTSGNKRIHLEDLGFSEQDKNRVLEEISKPHGMILSVGPTGSGKSTTLYTILQMLNKPEVNIMTIEDPVEFDIPHIQQIPVNLKKNVTFSEGLRAIVRQDPDIVMVGEIRDTETANIAVNAAMTGHLLLSTLHANDAATTFPRIIDLGVEPFLVASSLNMVVAQRLLRKICDKCRESYELTEEEHILIENNPEVKELIQKISGKKDISKIRLYRGTGCSACNNTGYRGRMGIFEIFQINEQLRTLVVQKSSADVIQAKAREMGMNSMVEDGLKKVFRGDTTLTEVMRVTRT